jgi:hypothetical protein
MEIVLTYRHRAVTRDEVAFIGQLIDRPIKQVQGYPLVQDFRPRLQTLAEAR